MSSERKALGSDAEQPGYRKHLQEEEDENMKGKKVLYGMRQAVCLLFLLIYALVLTVAVVCIQIGACLFTQAAAWLRHVGKGQSVYAVQKKTEDSGQRNTDIAEHD